MIPTTWNIEIFMKIFPKLREQEDGKIMRTPEKPKTSTEIL